MYTLRTVRAQSHTPVVPEASQYRLTYRLRSPRSTLSRPHCRLLLRAYCSPTGRPENPRHRQAVVAYVGCLPRTATACLQHCGRGDNTALWNTTERRVERPFLQISSLEQLTDEAKKPPIMDLFG